MPDAFMIGHQRAASAFWNARNASGDCWSTAATWMPRSPRRVRVAGWASTRTIAAFSFAMMSLCVPLGTHNPYHNEAKKPGMPASSAVGMSGDDGSLDLPVIANGLTLLVPSRDLKFEA